MATPASMGKMVAAPPTGAGASAPVEDDTALRAKLKEIFDKFDADGSGAVSTVEMGRMIKMLDLQMTSEEIVGLMVDADPDGSGEIDFEEFVLVLKEQIAAGKGGGLAKVVNQAGGFFNFLNLSGLFSGASAGGADGGGAASSSAEGGSAGEGTKYRHQGLFGYVASPRSPVVSPRVSSITYTQWLVMQGNQATGKEVRELEAEWKAAKAAQEGKFFADQEQRIARFKKESEKGKQAVAWMQYSKMQDGLALKAEIERLWRKEIARKKAFAGKAKKNKELAQQQSAKKAKSSKRKADRAEKKAHSASLAERAKREEAKLKEKEAEAAAAAERTERVRYETRPALRQEGREMFQAQRDALAAETRNMAEIQKEERMLAKEQFLYEKEESREQVLSAVSKARASRGNLAAQRKADADAMRAKLGAERRRGMQKREEMTKQALDARNSIYESRFASIPQSEKVFSDSMYQSLTPPKPVSASAALSKTLASIRKKAATATPPELGAGGDATTLSC